MKMVVLSLILASVVLPLSFAQSGSILVPELIHVFPIGKQSDQLGMVTQTTEGTNGPLIVGPNSFSILSNGSLVILDNANARLVFYSKNIKQLSEFPISPWLTRLSISNGLLVGWSGLEGSFIINPFRQAGFDLVIRNLKTRQESFDFCLVINKLAIFQYQTGEYFAIDYGTDSKQPRLVSNSELVKYIESIRPSGSYDLRLTNEKTLMLGAELASHGIDIVRSYFHYAKYSNEQFRSLANGTYLFFTFDYAWIVDEHGEILREIDLPFESDKYANMISDIVPSPEGYLYYLNRDKKTPAYRLYRVGPYPELRIDYRGASAILNDNQVRLRDTSSTKGEILYQFSKGDTVRILGQSQTQETINGSVGFWYKVRTWDDLVGWVFGAFLDIPK